MNMRPYAGESDRTAMGDLLLTAPTSFETYPTTADLPELLDPMVADASANVVIWDDAAGTVRGFDIVDSYNNLLFHFRPGALTDDREREMMDWAVACMRQRAKDRTGGEPVTLDASARDDDTAKVAFLKRHGFAPTGVQSLHMARSLGEPVPEPQLPPGFVVRPLAGPGEISAYVATHRAAYGSEQMTAAMRTIITQEASYRPDLDLVAISPDGTLAAFCVCAIEADENERTSRNEGEIAIVGTRPQFQRRGLGRAIVLAGLRGLQACGLDTATLSVTSTNATAIRAYQSVGFRAEFARQWYAKPIAPAAPDS